MDGWWIVPFFIMTLAIEAALWVAFDDGYDWLAALVASTVALIVSLTAWLIWAVLT